MMLLTRAPSRFQIKRLKMIFLFKTPTRVTKKIKGFHIFFKVTFWHDLHVKVAVTLTVGGKPEHSLFLSLSSRRFTLRGSAFYL